jgi:glutathione S-transferase
MSLTLYAHPFSSYCQKAIVALYENETPFELRMVNFADAEAMREFEALWPIERMPVLVDGNRSVMEASIIIEYLDLHHAGLVRLLPEDPKDAIDVRFMDRFFDNYVMTPMQWIVADSMRSPTKQDSQTVTEARALLDTAYLWLDKRMTGCEWASGDGFSLADCAAAPALFYADWTHLIGDAFPHVRAYRNRLLARPSFARAVDEAREYRPLFPLGAPDRD